MGGHPDEGSEEGVQGAGEETNTMIPKLSNKNALIFVSDYAFPWREWGANQEEEEEG